MYGQCSLSNIAKCPTGWEKSYKTDSLTIVDGRRIILRVYAEDTRLDSHPISLPGLHGVLSNGEEGKDGRSEHQERYAYNEGDAVGVILNLMENCIHMTRNGEIITRYTPKEGTKLFPGVGLAGPGTEVDTNFGQERFVFEIESYYQDVVMRNAKRMLTSLDPSPIISHEMRKQVRRSLLMHLIRNNYEQSALQLADKLGLSTYARNIIAISMEKRKLLQKNIRSGNSELARLELGNLMGDCDHCIFFQLDLQRYIEKYALVVKAREEARAEYEALLEDIYEFGKYILDKYRCMSYSHNVICSKVLSLICLKDPSTCSWAAEMLGETRLNFLCENVNAAVLKKRDLSCVLWKDAEKGLEFDLDAMPEHLHTLRMNLLKNGDPVSSLPIDWPDFLDRVV